MHDAHLRYSALIFDTIRIRVTGISQDILNQKRNSQLLTMALSLPTFGAAPVRASPRTVR